jgi:hypothetical protein
MLCTFVMNQRALTIPCIYTLVCAAQVATNKPLAPMWGQPANTSFFSAATAPAVKPAWEPIAPLSFGDFSQGFGQAKRDDDQGEGEGEEDGQVDEADVQIKKGEGIVQVGMV